MGRGTWDVGRELSQDCCRGARRSGAKLTVNDKTAQLPDLKLLSKLPNLYMYKFIHVFNYVR